MISVVVGRPGTGKTIYLVGQILKWTGKKVPVYSNVEIKWPVGDPRQKYYKYIQSLEEITKLSHGKIILDEIQTYLNSRNWDKLDIKFQLLLQQHRKRGLDIIGATQSIKRADVVFRELVHVFERVWKIFAFKIFGRGIGVFVLREYDPDSIESSTGNFEPVGWFRPFVADPFLMKIYDTTQEYLPPPEGDRVMVEYEVVHEQKKTLRKISEKTIGPEALNPVLGADLVLTPKSLLSGHKNVTTEPVGPVVTGQVPSLYPPTVLRVKHR